MGATSFGIDYGSGADIFGGREGLLARDRRLLQIFGWGPCWFYIFGSVLMSVDDIDAPNWSNGADMTCGRLGLRRYPIDGVDDID